DAPRVNANPGFAAEAVGDGLQTTAVGAAIGNAAAATLVPSAGGESRQSGALGLAATARWAFVVNLPTYAAHLQFAPGALGTDGQLEVATFRYGSLLQGIRYLGYLWTGQHSRLSASDYGRSHGRHIRIEADVPVRYQLDGDPGGLLPLSIDILPNRLTLVAPPQRVAALTGMPE
ncbi:MAG TPA: hypothetical protein VGG30_08460, partial [Pirellulales bacterium]